MSYRKTAPGLTHGGSLYSWQMQRHVMDSDRLNLSAFAVGLGAIDAPDYFPAGSCIRFEDGDLSFPYQAQVDRSLLDAYEYTEATARVTDCASEGLS